MTGGEIEGISLAMRVNLILVSLVYVLLGCDGMSTTGDGGAPVADGGSPVVDGGSPPRTSCSTDSASSGAGGELTAFPHINTVLTPARYQLLSINFVVTESDDPRGDLFEMYAEIENQGTESECSFLPDSFLDFNEIVSILTAPPHFTDIVTTVTSNCLAPGEVGVIRGVARGITIDDLAVATSLTIDLNPGTFARGVPATGVPSLTTGVQTTAEGWVVAGQVTPSASVSNYALRVFPRDARGLLINELLAFPGELALLPGGLAQDLETEASPCEFTEYLSYQSWIVE